MERSLKTWRVGDYQVQIVRKAYRVRGLGPLWGRSFNLRERKPGSWFLNLQKSSERIRLRIPTKSSTHSKANCPPVPRQTVHFFRGSNRSVCEMMPEEVAGGQVRQYCSLGNDLVGGGLWSGVEGVKYRCRVKRRRGIRGRNLPRDSSMNVRRQVAAGGRWGHRLRPVK